jgi:enoyl-[acyl-carrier protein] reductase II
MVFNSKVCQLCGIRYPIFLGPMMNISTAPVVSAFSQAGGLGCLASAGMQNDELRRQIRRIRQQTDAPFAVNIAWTVPNSTEILQVLLEEEVEIIVSSAGSPGTNLEKIKAAGVKVFQVVANVSQAKRAEAQGLDGIITKGFESGGLNSLEAIATLPLVPMVVDAVSIPVIAAGGIGDGRSMAAALALGAEGVLMGTRFLISDESPVHIDIKKALVKARDTDTVSVSFQNFSARFWKNKKSSGIIGHEPLWDLATDLNQEIDPDGQLVGAGQIVGLDAAFLPVAEIIQRIIAGYEESICKLNQTIA